MIEPFEYEPKRLNAPPPTRLQTPEPLQGATSIDKDVARSMSSLQDSMHDLTFDMRQARIFQTRLGNPSTENPHQAQFVVDRLVGKGLPVVDDETPAEEPHTYISTSERLSRVLDKQASYVPSFSNHVYPSLTVNNPEEPFLSPGITSVDARKVHVRWA